MHTEKIIALMQGQAQYNKKTLSDLSKIMRKYPYFQTAHLLYTLNLFHLEDTYFLYELRKTATYLNDRKKLFFLVENRYFDSDKIKALQHEIPKNPESAFNLIDSFLSEKEEANSSWSEKEEINSFWPEKEETNSFWPEKEEITDKVIDKPKEMQSSSAVSTDYVSYYLSKTPEETINFKPLQFQDTIDRFLKKDEISPIKIELQNTDKAEKTPAPDLEQVDDSDFYSETLAKIHIKQRKYDKALEIIRKIVLFYPEKSSYFADQIQMLEDLVNINKNKTE